VPRNRRAWRRGAAQCMAILRKRERLEVLLIDGDIM